MPRLKVLLVDDSLTIRAMLEEFIGRHEKLKIVGVATSAEEASGMVQKLYPDVLVLDVDLPGISGLQFLERLPRNGHVMKIVVLSSRAVQGSETCNIAFDRGAVACFDKAKLVRNGGQLTELLVEAGYGRINRHGYRGEAVSLPALH